MNTSYKYSTELCKYLAAISWHTWFPSSRLAASAPSWQWPYFQNKSLLGRKIKDKWKQCQSWSIYFPWFLQLQFQRCWSSVKNVNKYWMIYSISFSQFPSHLSPRPNLFETCCSHQIQKMQTFITIYEVCEVKH